MSVTDDTPNIGCVHAPEICAIHSLATVIPMATITDVNQGDIQGERFHAVERLVVAPSAGIFEPAADVRAGSAIAAGQVVGHLTSGVDRAPIVSQFDGHTGAALAWSGERVVGHQPVLWLSVAGPSS